MVAAFAHNRAFAAAGVPAPRGSRTTLALYVLAFATALMMGLRFQVGADWYNYLDNYDLVQFLTLDQSWATFDIGYSTLVYAATRLEVGIWFVNLICGLVMTLGVVRFCSRQRNPALTFLVAVPYLIIVVGMGYTRQGVAIGIVLAGLADAGRQSSVKLVLFILAAALFHRTALLVLPLALAPLVRRNLLQAILGVLASLVLFALLLQRSTDQLIATYITDDYESSGAVVRVAMNVVPAMLALALRRRLGFNAYERDMWTVFALLALAIFPIVLTANFTTAIDRLALFLIPLQLAVLPRLPYAVAGGRSGNAALMLAVCAYSAAVQLIWLVYATHATYWVPYRMVILDT